MQCQAQALRLSVQHSQQSLHTGFMIKHASGSSIPVAGVLNLKATVALPGLAGRLAAGGQLVLRVRAHPQGPAGQERHPAAPRAAAIQAHRCALHVCVCRPQLPASPRTTSNQAGGPTLQARSTSICPHTCWMARALTSRAWSASRRWMRLARRRSVQGRGRAARLSARAPAVHCGDKPRAGLSSHCPRPSFSCDPGCRTACGLWTWQQAQRPSPCWRSNRPQRWTKHRCVLGWYICGSWQPDEPLACTAT